MNKYLKLSLISVVVSTFLISCGEPDYSDDGSSYVSGNGYYGSCYSAATATCGYYFDMTSSEYTNMRSQCSNCLILIMSAMEILRIIIVKAIQIVILTHKFVKWILETQTHI